METPSSTTRRVTRSQTKAAASTAAINNIPISKRFEESEKKGKQGNGKQQERSSALIDITNGSPIIGLAMVTPSSAISKKRVFIGQATPGSGEALLRGQVKNLLQKVEEEADLTKVSLDLLHRPFLHLQGFVNSPMNFLAPTPANTPHLNPSENVLPSVTPSLVEDKIVISQMIIGKKEDCEAEESNVTRSLLLDFSEKSEGADSSDCSSMLTYEGGIKKAVANASDDDVSSVWSIQANASGIDDDDEEDGRVEEEECDDEYYEEEEEEVEDGLVDELCQGISKIGINGVAKFAGKHTRFVYNSDGELEGEEEEEEEKSSALRLKGLPTPKGKHIRFPEEEN